MTNIWILKARWWVAVMLVGAVLLVSGLACSSQSPKIGIYHKGRVLHVNVAAMLTVDEVKWTTSTRLPKPGATGEQFFRLQPTSEENEFVLMRVKVENHTATSVLVNINEQSAQLRDFLQGRYFPLDVEPIAQEVGVPETPRDRCNFPADPQSPEVCAKFLWNERVEEEQDGGGVKVVVRAQELPKGHGLDGWMIFEVPKDTAMRTFRWSAGDSVTIDF